MFGCAGTAERSGGRNRERRRVARAECEKLDYAVELGVLTLPSIVIDGELVFTSMPSPEQWRAALKQRTARPS